MGELGTVCKTVALPISQGGVRVLAELLERIGHRASSDVVGCHVQSTPPAVRRQRWEGRRAGKVVAAAEPCIGRAMKCQRATCSHLELDPIPLVRLLKPRPILF